MLDSGMFEFVTPADFHIKGHYKGNSEDIGMLMKELKKEGLFNRKRQKQSVKIKGFFNKSEK